MTPQARLTRSGGRSWWAHFEFTRINIEPIILRKKIEGLRRVRAFHVVRGEAFTLDRVRRDLVEHEVRRLYEQRLEHGPTYLTECRPKDSSIWTRLSIMATVEPCPGPRSSIAMSYWRRRRQSSGRGDTKRRRPKISVLPWELDAKASTIRSAASVRSTSRCSSGTTPTASRRASRSCERQRRLSPRSRHSCCPSRKRRRDAGRSAAWASAPWPSSG